MLLFLATAEAMPNQRSLLAQRFGFELESPEGAYLYRYPLARRNRTKSSMPECGVGSPYGSDTKPDHVACMLLLLDYMANPTLMDQLGRTGRDIAALKGNYQLVAALDTRMAEKPWQEED